MNSSEFETEVNEEQVTEIVYDPEPEQTEVIPASEAPVKNKGKRRVKIIAALSAAAIALGTAAAVIIPQIPDKVIGERPVIALADSTKNFSAELFSADDGTFHYENSENGAGVKVYDGKFEIDRENREILIGAVVNEKINDFSANEYYAVSVGETSGRYVVMDFRGEVSSHSFSKKDLNFDLEYLWQLLDGNNIKPENMIDTVDSGQIVTSILSKKKIAEMWGKFAAEFIKEENQDSFEKALNVTSSGGKYHAEFKEPGLKSACTVVVDIIDKCGKGKANTIAVKLLRTTVKHVDKVIPENFGVTADWDFKYRKLTEFSYSLDSDGSKADFRMKYTLGKKLKSFEGERTEKERHQTFQIRKFNKTRKTFDGIPSEVMEKFEEENRK